MARLTRIIESKEELSWKVWTRDELDKLKKIIEKQDNIKNFSDSADHKSHEKIKELDLAAENLFDTFFVANWNQKEHISWKPLKEIINDNSISEEEKTKTIQKEFKEFLVNIINNDEESNNFTQDISAAISSFKTHFEIINREKEEQEKTIINLADIELDILQNEIRTIKPSNPWSSRRSSLSQTATRNETYYSDITTKEKENNNILDEENEPTIYERLLYRKDEDYVDEYPKRESYLQNENLRIWLFDEKIEDIYSDKRIAPVLAKIFWEDNNEVRKRHLEINLGVENWLAWIILDIESEAKRKSITINKDFTIFDILKELWEIPADKSVMDKDDTKKILDKLDIPYKKDGIFADFRKLTKLFNNVEWKNLIAFANLLQARTNVSRATKEWSNNKKILESGEIRPTNVFDFLSDINSDWIVSAEKSRKNKEQFKVWDVGNISGQQLLFTLEQAEKTQDAVLWNGKWEWVVVKNITKMISLMIRESEEYPEYLSQNYAEILSTFKDTYSQEHREQMNNILNSENPTKQDLVDLLEWFPESKVFFLAAVEKVTWWSSINQADLYDVLTGQEGKRLQQIDSIKEMEDLRRSLDFYIKWNPDFKKLIEENWSIELRETILQKIMDTVDKIGLHISFDPATEKDMIMSNVNKTFYREQAKKKILGEFNIQNISIWTNLSDIKLSYKIWKASISEDWKSKYHIAWWPSFYLWKNGISWGLDINFSHEEQINYAKVSSASLDDVQKAKYLGVEWWAGAKAWTKWIGLYAALWLSKENDPLMGIMQLKRTYQSVSNRIFDISELEKFTKQSIQSHLESKIDSLKSWIYKDFIIKNNKKLKENIRFVISYLEKSWVLREINNTYKSTKEKEAAIWSLLRIIQQGNIDQWKWDVIMNLNWKIDLTRFSAGITAGTWFFGTKSNNYTWNSNAGESNELDWQIDPEIPFEDGWIVEESSGSEWGNRIWFLGVYASARISTWKNKYLPNSRQFLATEREMNQWIIDHIDAGKDLNKYASYLEWLFNKTRIVNWEKKWIIVEKMEGKNQLKISYKPFSSDEKKVPLHKLLNIHYADDEQFIYTNNVLIVWNVWPISAYTTTLPNGVDRVLCLGTNGLDKTTRLTSENIPTEQIKDIEFKENGFEYFNKTKLDQTIDNIALWEKLLADSEKTFYKNLFDNEGKLLAHANVTLHDWLILWQKFNTGTLTLYKKSDGKYILDYQPSPDWKLILEYKTIWTTPNEIIKENNIALLTEDLSEIMFPIPWDIAKIEYENNDKKSAFDSFNGAVVSADLDKATENLIKILDKNKDIPSETIDLLKSWSYQTKQHIVDSYLSLFAYEHSYKWNTIKDVFTTRWYTENYDPKNLPPFLKYRWPWKENFDTKLKKELFDKRKDVVENTNGKYENIEREKHKNIFGYTAFYRRIVAKDNKWYAPTAFGDSNIIKWSIRNLEEQSHAKNWIVENLKADKNKTHIKVLLNQIKDAIKNPDIASYIDENNLTELITTWKLETNNTNPNNPLDISSKIIKLDSEAIFYLLGECLNESVWLRINEIRVEEKIDTYKAEADPDKRYVSNLFGRSNSISGEIESKRSDFGIAAHKEIKSKHKEQKDYTWDSESWESDDLTTEEDEQIDFE